MAVTSPTSSQVTPVQASAHGSSPPSVQLASTVAPLAKAALKPRSSWALVALAAAERGPTGPGTTWKLLLRKDEMVGVCCCRGLSDRGAEGGWSGRGSSSNAGGSKGALAGRSTEGGGREEGARGASAAGGTSGNGRARGPAAGGQLGRERSGCVMFGAGAPGLKLT
jgi:hypothetical protein